MILRMTPANKEDYIIVDEKLALKLQVEGFMPKYIDESGIYFPKSDKIYIAIKELK